jgi:DNA polymerase
MNILILDFETYFDAAYSLRKLSIPEYVHDPRFHVHGLAVGWPDGRREFRTDAKSALQELQAQFGRGLQRTTVVCHHAHFDLYVLCHRFGIRPRHFIDTLSLAHHVHGRRDGRRGEAADLAALAERYGLGAKGDLDFMCGVRNPDARQLARLSAYAKQDVELTARVAEYLLPEVTRPEVELPILMHTTRLFTERAITIDVNGIDAIEQQVQHRLTEQLSAAGVTPEIVSGNKLFQQHLEQALARTGRKLPLKQGKNGLIPATAKTDSAMQELVNDDDPLVEALASARLEKKGHDQLLARLATLKRITAATGGKLPAYLVYYGGHTGRFAGGGGFNIQNLGKKDLAGQVRGLVVPRRDHKFIIADYSQIEARITAWYAGEEEMLAAFGQNRDLYSEFASRVFQQAVRKPTAEDAPAIQSHLSAMRQVGKRAVLGLGFGMGALKFLNTLRGDSQAARLFDNGKLTPVKCREIVAEFRRTYPAIPRFWKELERAVRRAVDGIESDVGTVHVARDRDTCLLHLPSGRALRYPGIRLDETERTIRYLDAFGDESEFTPFGPSLVYAQGDVLYGGKLCENVVQATARDLLVEAVLRLEASGHSVLFHVHDEVVVEVGKARVGSTIRSVDREVSRVPSWAHGIPVSCELKAADRYEK